MSNANSGLNQTGASAVGQTANLGRGTSMGGGAAKVFREFKWGLLTLFLLMVVVIGLVYDGGRKKKTDADAGKVAAGPAASPLPEVNLDASHSPPVGGPELPPSRSLNMDGTRDAGIETLAPIPTLNPPEPRRTPEPVPGLRVPAPPAPGGRPVIESMPSPVAGGDRTYTVKPGDNLTRIANSMLPGKGNVKAILDANKDVLPNANKLRAGIVLRIPASLSTVATPAPAVSTTKIPGPQVPDARTGQIALAAGETGIPSEYVVQSGDTLEKIARRVLKDGKRWRDLYEWNRDKLPDPSHLRAGQVLRIKQSSTPATAPVPGPGAVRAATPGKADPKKVVELIPFEASEGPAPASEVALPALASPEPDELNEPIILNRTTPVDLP